MCLHHQDCFKQVPLLNVHPIAGEESGKKRVESYLGINSERVSKAISQGDDDGGDDYFLLQIIWFAMYNICQLFGICIYADNLNSFTFNNRTGSSPNILDVKENNFTFIFTISQFSQLEAVQTSSHCHLPSMPGRSLPRSENNNSFPKI